MNQFVGGLVGVLDPTAAATKLLVTDLSERSLEDCEGRLPPPQSTGPP
jgi:hypothetical protein